MSIDTQVLIVDIKNFDAVFLCVCDSMGAVLPLFMTHIRTSVSMGGRGEA
jgi:hypothetical protein